MDLPPESPVTLPRISDYWPDPPDPPSTAKRSRLLAGVLGAVLLLGVSGVVLIRLVSADDPAPAPTAAAPPDPGFVVGAPPNPPVSVAPAPTSTAATTPPPPAPPPSAPPPSAPSPSAPPGPAFRAGTFVLASDLTELNVSLGRPPRNGIARVGTPPSGGVAPDADLDGTTLELTAKPRGNDGRAQVDVVLDERITWTVRMAGGVRRARFDLAGGSVRDIAFEGGANQLDLTLPRQERRIEIRMAGGVHRWIIGTEGEFPVQVRLRKGAGEVDLNGDRDRDVDRGRTLRSRGKDETSGGLTIEAVEGIGTLSVAPLQA